MKKLVFTAFAVGLSLTASVLGQVPNYVPTNGLVGYWPFNGNANDESGNGNNGTVNGATLTTDRFGVASKAYLFVVDGNTSMGSPQQRITISNPNIPQINSFTMSSWVCLSNKPSPYNDRPHSIMGRWDGNGTGVFRFQVNNNSDYYSGETFLQGDLPRIISCPLISFNEWHHHLISYDGSTFRQYLDGIMINEYVINIQIPYSTSDLTFGETHMSNGHWLFFNGIMDDLGYWSRALSECEIQDLYHAQLGSQAINAGADQTICKGDNVTLQALGGNNYQWNNNVIDGQTFSPIQTSNYVVQGTDSVGCIGTDSVVVSVLEHSASTLNETALDAYTLNGQTYTQSGTYTQTIPAANGCDSIITLNLTLNFTAIGNQEAEPLTIYPNPTTKHITIDNGNISAMAGYSIKIENNAGQQVFQSAINQAQFYVDLSTWTGNGLYFVHLIDSQNNTVTVRKIVLQ